MGRSHKKSSTITVERREELRKVWYYLCPDWTKVEYDKWYEELTSEEQGLINAWNKKYLGGLAPYGFFDKSEPTLAGPSRFSQNSCCRDCPHKDTGCNACFHDD